MDNARQTFAEGWNGFPPAKYTGCMYQNWYLENAFKVDSFTPAKITFSLK